ncbi:hypothetical protein BaRGS_00006717 [Batillaria attramentaria]|uniref:Uncharacterized protein n=1 Tax=Batillaria attramentaria TaxID=370345 RepID=A0ABD0LQX6_9CAEN
MEAEKCFFALVLLVLTCCFPELAVSIGCVTKDWDCDEGWFCSLRDNRCKACSEIAQYFCHNLTEIQARFKECINYCFGMYDQGDCTLLP